MPMHTHREQSVMRIAQQNNQNVGWKFKNAALLMKADKSLAQTTFGHGKPRAWIIEIDCIEHIVQRSNHSR